MKQERILRVARLEALTDGIFAIALTILILSIQLPTDLVAADLSSFLKKVVVIKLFVYVGSFIILITQWIGAHVQQGYLERINRPYIWASAFYLMNICVVPFSADFLANYPQTSVAIQFYAVNLIGANLGWLFIWKCAHFYKLNKETCTPEVYRAVSRRIQLTFLFYFGSLISSYWSTHLAFIILIAPPLMHMIVLEKSLKNI